MRVVMNATAALALLACSGSAEPGEQGFPEQPLLITSSASGQLELEVRTSPEQPPVRGSLRVELTLRDEQGPVSDVDVGAVPWMPSMGHGAPVEPRSSAEGGGKYLLSDVELYMPGRWQLRLELGGAVSDNALVVLDVR